MVRRSLNWKVFLITLLVGSLVAPALFGLHAWQIKRISKALLVLSDTQEGQSDWLKSAEYLDRYLRLNADDHQARVRLALVYGRFAELPGVLPYHKARAIELHYHALAAGLPEQELKIRRGLAELLLEIGRFAAAEKESKRVLLAAGADDPQGLRVLAIALTSQLAQGALAGTKTEELDLVKTVTQACQANPTDAQLATVLATLYREYPLVVLAEFPDLTEPERQQRANQCLDRLISESPQLISGLLARYEYRARYGQNTEGLVDLETALELAPNDSEVQLAAATNAYARAVREQHAGGNQTAANELFERALSHYEQLLLQPVNQHLPQYYLGRGDALLGLGKIDQALSTWREGIQVFDKLGSLKKLTTQATFYARLADACIEDGTLGDAREALDKIDESLANLDSSVRQESKARLICEQDLRRSNWHIKRLEFAEAIPLLRKVITQTSSEPDQQPTFRALLRLGDIYSRLGSWRDAATHYDQASSLNPNFQPCLIAAANSWLSTGRAEFAVERAEQALRVSSTFEAWSAIAAAQFQYQLSRPYEDRSWSRFEQALDLLETTSDEIRGSTPWQIDFLRADYLIVRSQAGNDRLLGLENAAKHLRQCEKKYTTHKEFWRNLSLAYQRLKRDVDADRALGEFLRAGGEAADVAVLQSRLASLRGNSDRAKDILRQASTSLPNGHEGLRQELLGLMLATKDLKLARVMLIQDHERQPHNLTILRRLAELDLELRDYRQVSIWERKLLEEGEPGEQQARFYRAWRLVESAPNNDAPELREAFHELEQLVLAQPNWPEAASLKGMTEQRLGRLDLAVADYERAVQIGEQRPFVFEQLISLLDQLQRPADVERLLARLGQNLRLSQRLVALAAEHEVRRDHPDRALAIARSNAEQRPTDPVAQLWLGRLLLFTNNESEAERVLLAANELDPTDIRVWNSLLALYVRTGNQNGLKTTLEKLKANNAIDIAQKSLLLGQANVALGNINEAKQNFIQGAKDAQDNSAVQLQVARFFMQYDPEFARSYLQTALRLDPKSSLAKRLLAILDASQGNLATAERLLTDEGGPADASTTVEDIRLHAALLIRRGGKANFDRALVLLNDLVARGPSSQDVDRLLLAEAYEELAKVSDGLPAIEARLQSAHKELMTLAERSVPNPSHLVALVRFLVRHERLSEAKSWLTKLENQVSSQQEGDPNAVATVIQAQILLGSVDRAEKWLKKLDEIGVASLGPLLLHAEAAIARDANAEISALIEPRAASLLAGTKTSEDKKKIYASLGNLYMKVRKFPAAEGWYRLLVAEDSTQYSALVTALVRQGRMQEAIELCEQAAKEDESVRPALVLARGLVEGTPQSEDFRRAEPILAAALRKFESDENLLYSIGVLRLIEGRNADSIKVFRQIVRVNPRSVSALNNLSMLLADTPLDQAEALRIIGQAIEIAGNDAGLLDTKGAILVYLGRSLEAVPLLEAATRDPQADPRHHFHLALAYRDVGKSEEAKRHLKTALERRLSSMPLTATDQKLLTVLRTALQL